MNTYHGSCHCRRVKLKVTTVLDKVVACNCSICTKKGVLHHRVTPEQFSLIDGKQYLTLYQFDTKETKHYFCSACGIHPFCHPRSAPGMYSINVRCLDDFDLAPSSVKMTIKLFSLSGLAENEACANCNKNT